MPESQFIVPLGGRDEQRLVLATSRGSTLRTLGTVGGHSVNSPSLSADRQSLLYIDRTEDSVRTIAVDGSGDRRLFGRPSGCLSITHITWNPADQSQLVIRCLDGRNASRMIVNDLEGNVVREISPPHPRFDDPALSPDGRSLVYWASDEKKIGGGSLYVVPTDGSSRAVRLTNPGSSADADPVWSPDGSRIAFTRRINAKNSNVYAISATGGPLRPVMTGSTREEKPAWSPSGKSLLVVSDRGASGRPGRRLYLYLARSSGNHVQRLKISATDLSTAVWSYR